jgi:hypothetical protein
MFRSKVCSSIHKILVCDAAHDPFSQLEPRVCFPCDWFGAWKNKLLLYYCHTHAISYTGKKSFTASNNKQIRTPNWMMRMRCLLPVWLIRWGGKICQRLGAPLLTTARGERSCSGCDSAGALYMFSKRSQSENHHALHAHDRIDFACVRRVHRHS